MLKHPTGKTRTRLALTALVLLAAGLAVAVSAHQAADEIPVYGYRVVKSYPHDPRAFTQGLLIHDGHFYESTGLVGRSTIRKVDITTGLVIKSENMHPRVFGEGITVWGDRIIGLTWRAQTGFEWDANTFKLKSQFGYTGEGWGITHNGTSLIMSDGTATLRFLDPETMRETKRLSITANGAPVYSLNELEWVNGEIFANIWQSNMIARINPDTGFVTGWINLTGLLTSEGPIDGRPDVLNGIAISPDGRLFVTGKLWPKMFEIEMTAP